MKTKKMLVAFDERKASSLRGDFLVVVCADEKYLFWGVKSRQFYDAGLMVFVGIEISESEVFAKLVDSGWKIASVDDTLKTIEAYIDQLSELKIGNVVRITTHGTVGGFELEKVLDMPKRS
jgi:hypothetical protein